MKAVRIASQNATVAAAQEVAAILENLGLQRGAAELQEGPNAVPQPGVTFPRCLPSRVARFLHDADAIANVAMTCGADGRGVVDVEFSTTTPDLRGAVKIQAGAIAELAK